jgi:UDP-galactopyranose mutase
MKVKIVGCGLSGIIAAILLKQRGYSVEIFETRNHIGGNCYDSNLNGVLVHNYGPHIFHTNDEKVWSFLNQYTDFTSFRYCPKAQTDHFPFLISLPYSLTTVSEIGRELSTKEIIDLIYKDYSEKQWGVPFEQISNSIISRVPVLKNITSPTWYEGERYQGIPSKGYTAMMNNMLEGIKVHLGVNSNEWKAVKADLTIYTGKIDDYFENVYGALPYRTLTFEHEITPNRLIHHAVNQCNKTNKFTRIYDHSYFLDQKEPYTVITKEYSHQYDGKGMPFYPISFGNGPEIYKKYKELADRENRTIFLGRLATYKYLDMWVTIKQAMVQISSLK